jgi:UDP-N-acetylglucosamine 4-epimerase
VACGTRMDLNALFNLLKRLIGTFMDDVAGLNPRYTSSRPGDVKHSMADISRAETLFGYTPAYSIEEGIKASIKWYVRNLKT